MLCMRHRIVPQHFCTSVLVEPSKVRACQVGCYGFPSLFFGGVHSLSLRSLYKDSTQAHPTIPLRAGVVVQTSSGDLSVLHWGEGVEPQLSALVTRQKSPKKFVASLSSSQSLPVYSCCWGSCHRRRWRARVGYPCFDKRK